MHQVIAMDTMFERLILAFLENKREEYASTMKQDHADIAHSQATYEVACIAMAAVSRFVAHVEEGKPLPKALTLAAEGYHDAICETGDDLLRAKGHKPEEF